MCLIIEYHMQLWYSMASNCMSQFEIVRTDRKAKLYMWQVLSFKFIMTIMMPIHPREEIFNNNRWVVLEGGQLKHDVIVKLTQQKLERLLRESIDFHILGEGCFSWGLNLLQHLINGKILMTSSTPSPLGMMAMAEGAHGTKRETCNSKYQ